jgi:hypothetical protein
MRGGRSHYAGVGFGASILVLHDEVGAQFGASI